MTSFHAHAIYKKLIEPYPTLKSRNKHIHEYFLFRFAKIMAIVIKMINTRKK